MKSKQQWMCMTVAAAGMFMMAACGENAGNAENSKDSAAISADSAVHAPAAPVTTPPVDATTQDSTNKGGFTEVGVIGEVTNGKDGFMATLTNDKGVVYSTVFSIMKLEKNYKKLKAGDRVQVSGDTMQLGDKTHIVVKQFTQQ
ncbi:hypothetical protein HNQ91_001936 [Filimonas zeae]|nr:hypothetical protein [Filimonas zeae]MDR6338885.1 hypothetical protein [Filimonas zeae]